MIMAGFAIKKDELMVNSGAFNTHVIGGHGYNGFKDVSKSLNEIES